MENINSRYDDLKEIIAESITKDLNPHQLDVLLEVLATDDGPSLLQNCKSHDDCMTLIKAWNLRKLDAEFLNRIEEHGWAIMGVMPDHTGPGFAYTVGASARIGCELFYSGPTNVATAVLNTYALALEKGDVTLDNIGEINTTLFKNNFRFRGVELEMGPECLDHVRKTHGTVTRVFQIYIPDENNVLPDEPGYLYDKQPQVLLPVKQHAITDTAKEVNVGRGTVNPAIFYPDDDLE